MRNSRHPSRRKALPRMANGADRRDPLRAPTLPSPSLLKTEMAAAYLGISPGALRKAKHDGRVLPVGTRYKTRRLTWAQDDLDRYLLGLPPRATVGSGRSSAPPSTTGGLHENRDEEQGNEVDQTME